MELFEIAIAGIIGAIAGGGFIFATTKEIINDERFEHDRAIERKDAEIRRLTACVTELQKRNAAQIDAYDRATGTCKPDYFKTW